MTPVQNNDHLVQMRRRLMDGLVAFLLSGDSDQGLSSSWTPLTNIALGGFGASPDPERMVTDRRYGMAGQETAVTETRRVRTALQRLSTDPATAALYFDVLARAHGPESWSRVVDSAFGRGMSIKVAKRLDDLAYVALLTEEVQKGFAAEPPLEAKGPWNNVGGWLVSLCMNKGEPAKKRCERIKKQAVALLESAEAAYLVERGLVIPKRERKRAVVAAPPPLFHYAFAVGEVVL